MKKSRYSGITLNKAVKSFLFFGVFPAGIILLSAGLLQAQLIDVDFNNDSAGAGHGGPNPGPTMSGAAVLGAAGDEWNGIDVSSGSGISLVNADGSSSEVIMTFTSGGGYDANSYGNSTSFAGTPYDALMEDYLYNNGVAQTITLSGLAANSVYNLILYSAADMNAAGRTTFFTVNGNTQSSVWDGASSTLIAGVDYVDFTSALSDGSGNLVITYTGSGSTEGDIDGFQIQAVPKVPFTISAGYDGANIVISFMTQSGFSYQMEYKNNLTDASWIPLGGSISGNDSVQSVDYLASENSCFYRVQVSTNTAVALSMLHTSGTSIVNASGAIVQLKGLNLGGWLVMEPWMCPADSGGLPDTYSIITELDSRTNFGVATEQSLIRIYQTNWITTADLDNITNGGFNCVRVPVWWGNFYSITNTTSSGWRSDAFSVLDWLVTNCASRGIYVIIDMHGVVGGQSTSDDTGQQNQNLYWTSSTDQSETAYMWTQIATHYNGNSTIAGYDLINEPDGTSSTSIVWPIYNSLYNTIRSVDTNHIIIMEGTFGNWNWSMLPNPSTYHWTNIVYSMHEYQYGGNTAQCEAGSDNQVTDFNNHKSWNVPDYIGEWNDMGNGAACYDYSISDYNNDGISWTMWAYKTDLANNGWGWYDPITSLPTPNVSNPTTTSAQISNDWQQWRTTTAAFGANSSVGL
jgi:endoglucanase